MKDDKGTIKKEKLLDQASGPKFSDQRKNQKINTKKFKINEKIGAISTYLSLAFSEVVVSGLVELLMTEFSVD